MIIQKTSEVRLIYCTNLIELREQIQTIIDKVNGELTYVKCMKERPEGMISEYMVNVKGYHK